MNKWKFAFFALLFSVAFVVGAAVYFVVSPAVQVEKKANDVTGDNVVVMQTTAKEFESLAKRYIGNKLEKSPLPVSFEVNESIQLFSTLTVFNVDVPITMDFDPQVEKGNVVLKQTSVNVGKLNIPPKTILKLMKESVNFPKWMVVNPNDAEIFVDLSMVRVADHVRVRAKDIDLANDQIVFEFIVPK